eukprot:g25443.t1
MEGDGAMPQSEGEISRKSQVDFAEEERASLPRELRRKWVSLREDRSGRVWVSDVRKATEECHQASKGGRVVQLHGTATGGTGCLCGEADLADALPRRTPRFGLTRFTSHRDSQGSFFRFAFPEALGLFGPPDLSSPIPSASRFRSEHMLVSEDFATEAAFRMKQFEHEEEDTSFARGSQ